mgnify:CR=1 FL=1
MRAFPFPDRLESREELKRDLLYRRIPEDDREKICDMAWNRGERIAFEILKRYPGMRIQEIAGREGLKLQYVEEEKVNAALRTFGEYSVRENKMILYQGSIKKWAQANELPCEHAQELISAHEFFHYMECKRIGETSKLYTVPTLRIGRLVLASSGIRALSEIGAHGFARTYFEHSIDG